MAMTMSFKETLKMALAGVSSNKFRTFLTLSGIIIGVASVILMVSLGSSTEQVVSGQFNSLNISRIIYLTSNYDVNFSQRLRLKFADGEYLQDATMGIEDVVPFVNSYSTIKLGDKQIQKTVSGVVPKSKVLTNAVLKYGRYIEESDNLNKEKVAVINEEILEELVNLSDYSTMIGKSIEIDREKYTIVGILAKSDKLIFIGNDTVVIPVTAKDHQSKRWGEEVSYYLLSYDKYTDEQDAMEQIKDLLNARYGKTSTGDLRYRLEGFQNQINTLSTVIKVFTYVLGGIAAISLLVGGIGVMNIMLVTVKERTREIGIRLAIGATRREVQNQFLTETILISVGGGIFGIIIGSGFSSLVTIILKNFFEWWQGNLPLWILIMSFGFTVTIGVVFGFYPAYKASRLDPIEALRHE